MEQSKAIDRTDAIHAEVNLLRDSWLRQHAARMLFSEHAKRLVTPILKDVDKLLAKQGRRRIPWRKPQENYDWHQIIFPTRLGRRIVSYEGERPFKERTEHLAIKYMAGGMNNAHSLEIGEAYEQHYLGHGHADERETGFSSNQKRYNLMKPEEVAAFKRTLVDCAARHPQLKPTLTQDLRNLLGLKPAEATA